ncbi:hypothetical protein HJG60_008046 [Phyllostomus discolor]|uniref:Uncharacterized protein n=1 Tax=Phyllostomus discolor TaxID=89673 RepID=A0A834BNW2_9CHIR|nr:hypothetical protein HJG60_008046 [Phyllostomus discolor]
MFAISLSSFQCRIYSCILIPSVYASYNNIHLHSGRNWMMCFPNISVSELLKLTQEKYVVMALWGGSSAHRAPLATTDENKPTKTGSAWGRSLKGEGPRALSSMGFYWVCLQRNTGEAHVRQ